MDNNEKNLDETVNNPSDINTDNLPELEAEGSIPVETVAATGGETVKTGLSLVAKRIIIGAAAALACGAIAVGAILLGGKNNPSGDGNGDPEPHSHSFGEWKNITDPTCTTDGVKERSCECGEKESEKLPAFGHSEQVLAAVEPGCTTAGLTEGKKCSVCDESLEAQTVVDAKGHTEEIIPAVEATCKNAGLTEGKKCSVCGDILVEQTASPLLPHTYDDEYDDTCNECGHVRDAECAHANTVTLDSEDATCTAPGLTEGKKCSDCGELLVAQTVVGAKGHTDEIIPAVDATCTETGLTEGKKCSDCGEILVEQIVVGAKGHIGQIIPAVAPTCTATGFTEGRKCSDCGTILVAQTVVGAKGHSRETIPAVGATCTETGLTEGVKCSDCGTILVAQTTTDMLGHSFSDNVCSTCGIDQPAGLYNADENLLASWDDLVTVYGMDVEQDYTYSTYRESTTSPYYILNNYPELDGASKIIIGNASRIGEHAFYATDIESVVISKNVAVIDEGAFEYCDKLKNVSFTEGGALVTIDCFSFLGTAVEEITIPESVETIYGQAFGYCDELRRVYIPSTVTEMSHTSFDDCPSLSEITVSANNTRFTSIDGNLYNKGATELLRYAPAKEDEVFTVPDGVVSIGYGAFAYANNLKTLIIGFDVRSIPYDAFDNCTSLSWFEVDGWNPNYASIDGNLYQKDYIGWYSDDLFLVKYAPGKVDHHFMLPSNATEIFSGAFNNITSLTYVDIGNVENISSQAFAYCSNLKTIKISQNLQAVDAWAFMHCSGLETIIYSGTEDEWNDIVIDNEDDHNSYLLSADVIFDDSVNQEFSFTSNGDGTCTLDGVYYSYEFESSSVIVVPSECGGDTVTGIAQDAFGDLAYWVDLSNKKLVLPDTITTIAEYAFRNSNFEAVYLSEGLLDIGNRAFACSDIPEIYIPSTVVSIGEEAFWESAIEFVCIPRGVESIGTYAFCYCENLRTLVYNSDFYFDGSIFAECNSISEISVPYGSAYYCVVDGHLYDSDIYWLYLYAKGSESEVYAIPDTVEHVEFSLLQNCVNLKKIIIPASVISIDVGWCPNIEHFEVSEDNEYYKSIDGSLYSKDGKTLIRQAFVPGTRHMVIRDGVTTIEREAIPPMYIESFYYEYSIYIPKSLETVKHGAFSGCYFSDVYYEGSEEEWDQIQVFTDSNGTIMSATKHYNQPSMQQS